MTNLIQFLKSNYITLGGFLLFFVVTYGCFAPQLQGEVLPRHDTQQFDGMSRDIRECREVYHEDPHWTGAMFSGMPAYMINIKYPAQILKTAGEWINHLPGLPAGFILLAMFSAWLMIILMGIPSWVGILVGLMYGLSTYFFLIIGAGHETKMWALAFAPAMVGGIYMTLRGKRWIGGALTALFASLEIGANHPQIAFYFFLVALALWINDLIFAIKENNILDFSRRTGILAIAGILAIGSNFAPLYYTSIHTGDTTRGGNELTAQEDTDSSSGLDLNYATAWSYGITESWNMFIPEFMGGDSSATMSSDGPVAKYLKESGLEQLTQYLPAYWGDQPYTAGPTYLGAIVIFLALMGLFLLGNRNKWWILAISILAIMLSWGHNFIYLTEIFFRYIPLYNKFRAVSTILVIVEWSVPLLAGLGIWKLYTEEDLHKKNRALLYSSICTAGICLVFILCGSWLFSFNEESTAIEMTDLFHGIIANMGDEGSSLLKQGLHEKLGWETASAISQERFMILRSSAVYSMTLCIVAALLVLLTLKKKISNRVLTIALCALIVGDLTYVNSKYLGWKSFITAENYKIRPTAADKEILKDTEAGFRVINMTVSPFNDATTSMFHRSVGGYHGAKLGRYQDVIEGYLQKSNEGVYDMLNTKYIIADKNEVIDRPNRFGPAWFVSRSISANTPKEEFELLDSPELRDIAIVNSKDLTNKEYYAMGIVDLTEYRPNYLKYEYSSEEPGLIVFSEIYDKGWKAYIDKEEVPALRANYILRALEVPEGTHTIEWRYISPKWFISEAITLLCSIIIIFALGAVAFFVIRQKKINHENS